MSKGIKKGLGLTVKRRNPEKVVMDRFYKPAAFKSRKRDLDAKDAQKQIKDYMRGVRDV